MNQRGEYGAPRLGAVAPETRRVHTNAALIGVGVALGLVGWRQYKQKQPLGVIALGAAGSLAASGISGLLLDREGGGGS